MPPEAEERVNSIASCNKLSVEIEKMFFFKISLLIDHFDYFHEPEYLNKLCEAVIFSAYTSCGALPVLLIIAIYTSRFLS